MTDDQHGKAVGTSRSVRRLVVASVAVTALAAAGVAVFGSAGSHPTRDVRADPPRTLDYAAAGLSSPPPWPSGDPVSGSSLLGQAPGAVPTTPGATHKGGDSSPGSGSHQPGSSQHHSTSNGSTSGGRGKTKSSSSSSKSSSKSGSTSSSKPSGPIKVDGQVSCTSGKSVEGVWVQAAKGSGYSPWKGLGNGSTSDYWYTLPTSESYSLHVGCGGSTSEWAVSVQTPTVAAGHNSFDCVDVAGQSGYGTCRRR